MAKTRKGKDRGVGDSLGLGGFLGGLGNFLEKLGDLAEKGRELRESGEIRSPDGKVRGIYGFRVKVGLGDEGLSVEPFGNVREDAHTGQATVHEVREPMVDVFEEDDHVLVVAEMPGVGKSDVRLQLREDILSIAADKGDKKYRKEVLLAASFGPDKMTYTCRNGVLEVKLAR